MFRTSKPLEKEGKRDKKVAYFFANIIEND